MGESATVLVCDDDASVRFALAQRLMLDGYRVVEASNGEEGILAVNAEAPDVVVTDLLMPGMDGLQLLRRLRQADNDLPVIVITAHGGIDSAVQATRLGASAYLSKPFDLRELSLAVDRALQRQRLETEVRYLRGRSQTAYGQIVGESPAMQRLYDTLRRLEKVDAPTVLVVGESGTGKDLVAQAIHEGGPRNDGPFMEVDCASLPEQLIESTLFGHERGAFTDAKATRRGLFEVARGGTIFLDEIGEMPVATQSKLLRALENRRFKRVGGTASIPLDAGIIAATNRELPEEIRAGNFREDLYYRLNVIRLEVPPLRERRGDVPLLAEHFLKRFNREFAKSIARVDGAAMELLTAYGWPGNVRELKNVVERIAILEATDVVRVEHLPPTVRYAEGEEQGESAEPFDLPEDGLDLVALERKLIEQALVRSGWNQTKAARLLRLSRDTLRYRIEKFDLKKP